MAKANGKVILVGEHAVVHGVPALACGVDLGMSADAVASAKPELTLDGSALSEDGEPFAAFSALCASLGARPCRLEVRTQMPTGVGLGASAAMGVAIARAIMDAGLAPVEADPRSARLLAAVNAWEGVFHGSPSGIDAACAVAGGCIRFQKGTSFEHLALPAPLPLAIAVAGPPSSTKLMVESVARLQASAPERFEQDLSEVRALVIEAERCLGAADWRALGAVLTANHAVLVRWQLSTPELEDCCELARAEGAWGAKLTGAGGGGCVIALPGPAGAHPILSRWMASGYRCFSTLVSSPGRVVARARAPAN